MSITTEKTSSYLEICHIYCPKLHQNPINTDTCQIEHKDRTKTPSQCQNLRIRVYFIFFSFLLHYADHSVPKMPLCIVLWTENKEKYKLWDTVLFMNGNNRYECNYHRLDTTNIDYIDFFHRTLI